MTQLILAATVALLALSTIIQGLRVQRSIDRSRKAFEALLIEIGAMGLANLNLDDEVARLKRRVAELESGSDGAQIQSQPHPLN